MIETLFVCNSTNSVQKEPASRPVLPSVGREIRVLDPKKSQNIAILLRALNVTQEEVSEALLNGEYFDFSPLRSIEWFQLLVTTPSSSCNSDSYS